MRNLFLIACCFSVLFECALNAQEPGVYRSVIPANFLRLPPPIPEAGELRPAEEGQVIQAGFLVEDKKKDKKNSDKADPEESTAKKLEDEKQEAEEKRDEVAEQIRVAESQLIEKKAEQEAVAEEKPKNEPAAPLVNADEELHLRLLKQLEVILAQREQQIQEIEDAEKEFAERNSEHQNTLNGQLGVEKPYSFLLFDQLQDELAALESKLASSQQNESLINADIVQAKEDLEEKEKAYRQARENGTVVAVDLESDTSRAGIELKFARETLDYRKRQLELQQINAKTTKTRVEIVQTKLAAIRDEVEFSENDLAAKQEEFDKRESELRQRLARVERLIEDSDVTWLSDRKLRSDETGSPIETEELELRRLQRQTLQTTASSLGFRLKLVNLSRQAWDNRYQFANALTTAQQNIEFEKQTKEELLQRERDFANRMLQHDELRKTVAALDTKIEALADDEAGRQIRRLIERQKTAARAKMAIIDEDVAGIQSNRRINEKLLADIVGDSERYSLANLWENTWHQVKNVWGTELTTVEERPITIGKVCLALLIFFGGYFVSRWLSRWLGSFLTHRIKIDQSASAAFQSLGFYGLLLTFLLGAMNFVSIPLTVFTFLGGALAIGVGFGSQNILSNFISGLILLAERPVKVGDLIQMDDHYGNIESIGARSTVVLTGTNLRLIVPNSKFLENNVINFTHGSNDMIRCKVGVGVAYGSDTRVVTKLLEQAADDHGKVLKHPGAFVLFKDFADNSLNFELHFWLNMTRPLVQLQVESDLRYRIDTLFNEAGIVIAFPQRDIHLDTTTPIPFRLVNAEAGGQVPKQLAG